MADANSKPPRLAVAEKSGWLSIYFDGLALSGVHAIRVRRGPVLRRGRLPPPVATWSEQGPFQGQEKGG